MPQDEDQLPRRRRTDSEDMPEHGSVEYRLGQHSAMIASLREDYLAATKRLDEIETKLDIAIQDGQRQHADLSAQIAQLATEVRKTFDDHQPLLTYVLTAKTTADELRAQDARRESESAARHQALAQRLNVVLPVALAMLASTILRNLETVDAVDQTWIQAGIAAVAGLYIVIVLVVLPRYDRAHATRVDGIEVPPHRPL